MFRPWAAAGTIRELSERLVRLEREREQERAEAYKRTAQLEAALKERDARMAAPCPSRGRFLDQAPFSVWPRSCHSPNFNSRQGIPVGQRVIDVVTSVLRAPHNPPVALLPAGR